MRAGRIGFPLAFELAFAPVSPVGAEIALQQLACCAPNQHPACYACCLAPLLAMFATSWQLCLFRIASMSSPSPVLGAGFMSPCSFLHLARQC